MEQEKLTIGVYRRENDSHGAITQNGHQYARSRRNVMKEAQSDQFVHPHEKEEEREVYPLRGKSSGTIVHGANSRERARSHPASFRARINSLSSDSHENTKGDNSRKLSEKKPSSSIRAGNRSTVELTLHESRSLQNLSHSGGGGDKWPNVTRHMLYKEAIYTCAHMLGKPSPRFPSNQEEITIYAHETFSVDGKEQKAVNEHVESEPFPFTIVNVKVIKADGLQAKDPNNLSDPYCVVALETEDSLHQKQWQTINIGSPLKPKKFKHKKDRIRPNAEHRYDQIYENVPDYIKTSVMMQTLTPRWEQRFQCLALRPGIDILAVEVWDHDGESNSDHVLRAIKTFKSTNTNEDIDESLHRNQSSSSSTSKRKRKPDDFLGKVTIKLTEIPVEGLHGWFNLEGKAHTKDKLPHGKIKLQIWLVHAYRHGRHYEEVVEPKAMLEKLWDLVLQVEKLKANGSGDWDGTIPKEATCLLFQYALQNGISEDSQGMIRWNAYAKIHLDVNGLQNRLTALDGVVRKSIEREAEGRRMSNLSNGQNSQSQMDDTQDNKYSDIEATMLKTVKEDICPIIRNHLHETEERVREAVKSFKHCREILSQLSDSRTLQIIIWLFEAALRMSILEWYEMKFAELVQIFPGMKRHQLVASVASVINEVNEVLFIGTNKWSPLFWLDGMTEYMPIVYHEFQKMIIHDVEAVCWTILELYDDNCKLRRILKTNKDEERDLSRALFDLYGFTQEFVQTQDEIFQYEKPDYYYLNLYHRWFRPILVLWLGFALIRGSEVISKAINIDNVITEDKYIKTSSSAVDTANVFYQLLTFWKKLAWPDIPESYVILNFLLEVICYYTDLYANLKHKKMDKEGYFDTVDRFDISERFCTALNNIEYVKEYMMKIPNEVMYHLLHELNEVCGTTQETMAYRKRLDDVISKTLFNVEIHFKGILAGVSSRLRPEINARIQQAFEFLETANSNYLEDALEPLLEYLEENIRILQECLMEQNFIRMLKLFWHVICEEFTNVTTQTTIGDQNEQMVFFTRVLQLFPILKTYFEGNGAGLRENDIYSQQFIDTLELIKFMTLKTKILIETYYGQRGDEQLHIKSLPKYGFIRIRLSFWQGKLSCEVISVSGLTAADESSCWRLCKKSEPNSDPIVELELMPESTFPGEEKHKTTIKWKTLNPTYDEKFYWSASAHDCEKPNSVLVLTVKDYDMLSKNDFLGEAIIPLRVIPGISKMPVPQPMTLNLRSVENKHCIPVLIVLKTRVMDREAQNFYSQQASRHVQDLKKK